MKSFIFGHSHVWSVRRALVSGTFESGSDFADFEVLLCGTQEFPGPMISIASNGKHALNACLISELKKRDSSIDRTNTNLISFVQGNYYNIVGLVQDTVPYDFVLPHAERLKRDETALNVPFDVIDEKFSALTSDLRDFLKSVNQMGYAKVLHVDAPPPIESEEFIIADLSEKGGFSPDSDKLAPPNLRRKLWLTQCLHVENICNEIGVTYIGAPKDTINSKGFLKKEYWKDAVHANEHYSALLLRSIEEKIEKEVQDDRE